MPDSDGETLQDLRLRRIFCEFLALVANIVLARAADEIQLSVRIWSESSLARTDHSTESALCGSEQTCTATKTMDSNLP